ncbi:MAG: hypothetical protein GY737_14015 [Desulfobacteraceae bacterium]|nr:hypothetical protein [Desulfobacteraceae bacterium]
MEEAKKFIPFWHMTGQIMMDLRRNPKVQKFDSDIEMMAALARELPDVAQVKILQINGEDVLSVEYNHNQWRDEFRTVNQLLKELRRQAGAPMD